jgi:hypothetical protein
MENKIPHVHKYMSLLDRKGELHQMVHCQIQLTLFKFIQTKV